METFDIVIIGSGMGGLVCADILGREGYKVCVLEKNKQIGGCLQTYVRNRSIFDSGVHYLGGLGKGQNLYQVFKYLGIMDKLRLQQMDADVFDTIIFENDDKEYVFAQGYENFIQHLLRDFPEEEAGLRSYCDTIKEVCSKFPLYNLRTGGDINEKTTVLGLDAVTTIQSFTNNKKLQEVLVGNNMLYVLQADKTPFYVIAMIMNSYIESAWKCVDGGSVIGKLIAKNIKTQGGSIRRNSEVTNIVVANGVVAAVQLKDGSLVHGKYVISNMHPVQTMDMIETDLIKNAYKSRIKNLENSIGGFVVNIVLKKGTLKYFKHNYYYHKQGHVWSSTEYTEANWPLSYAIFCSASSKSEEDAECLTLLTLMKYTDVEKWANTFNTVSAAESRGVAYENFKIQKAETLIDLVAEKFPFLRDSIAAYYVATPLSYRDYIGTNDGAMYGIVKDYRNPLKTMISPRTKIPNLYLTGQNLNLHGILGATMSGLVTCCSLLGNENIIDKIRNA